jgi:effector-binding domain-containing protein/uncharacterized protein YndB with AHSA1/START domain
MRIVKFLFVLVIVLAAVLLGGGMLLPDTLHVERSTVIARSPAHVYAVLNDYRRFNQWSPWAAKDPNATYTWSGPSSGVGAKLSWVGDPETVGSGSQEITASVPDQRVETALDFGEHGKATAAFVLTPEGQGTKVVWGFDTSFEGNLFGRWFGLFMEKMLAPDYEAGLANLKKLVETFPDKSIAGLDPETIDYAPLNILYLSAQTPVSDAAAVGAQMGQLYGEISALMTAKGLQQTAPPVAVTNAFADGVWSFDAGIPVDRTDIDLSADNPSQIKAGVTPSGKALRFVHTGPYSGLGEFSERVEAWLAVHAIKPRDRAIDQYVSDPGNTPEPELVTHLIYPID